MKRFFLILAVLVAVAGMAAAEEPAVLKVTGDTGATIYHDDGAAGVFDFDQNVNLALWKLNLALNAGFTHTFGGSDVISWAYKLGYAQVFGPLSVYASLASDSMNYTLGGSFAGDLLDDIVVGADFVKGPFAVSAYGLFSAVTGYPFFMGTDFSVAYAPKWGSFRIGATFLDPQAVTDDVGYNNAVAAVEGLSFYAKAKVSY